MATESAERAEPIGLNFRAGVLGGVVGSIAMGILVVAMNAPTLAVAIPSLYTLAPPASLPLGFAVHVFHGAVFGLVFAGAVGALDIGDRTRLVGIGVGWGVVTWAVFAALVMPLWLSAVGSPASPPFPNFAPPSLLWHVVYGAVLGVVYSALE